MGKYEKRQGHGMTGDEVMGYVLEEIRDELEESNKLKRHELNIENYDGTPFTKEGEGNIPDDIRG